MLGFFNKIKQILKSTKKEMEEKNNQENASDFPERSKAPSPRRLIFNASNRESTSSDSTNFLEKLIKAKQERENKYKTEFKPTSNDLRSNENLRKAYSDYINKLESEPVNLNDVNVQQIYNQACNYMALQSITMMVHLMCKNNPVEEKKMYDTLMSGFFKQTKFILSRKLEVNELHTDSDEQKNILGADLVDRFNKCQTKKVLEAVNFSEDLMRKSLKLDSLDVEISKRKDEFNPSDFNPNTYNPDSFDSDNFNPDNFDPEDPNNYR